jgi:FtsP/CotA-like multicopper oxidase with cupredoxin domain
MVKAKCSRWNHSAVIHIEIAEIDWELAPKKKIRTTAYNGQIPGPLLRVTEGKPGNHRDRQPARSP